MRYEYFTDGSCSYNTVSSWAWVETTTSQYQLGICKTRTTSMRMEMQGILHALQHALTIVNPEDEVVIHTDNQSMVAELFRAVETFYSQEDMSLNMSSSDLWIELVAAAIMLHEACVLSIYWISRKDNYAHHYAAMAKGSGYVSDAEIRRMQKRQVRSQLAGGL